MTSRDLQWYNINVVSAKMLYKLNMRECWNWQTGTFEGRVLYDVWVQVPSRAPVLESVKPHECWLFGFLFLHKNRNEVYLGFTANPNMLWLDTSRNFERHSCVGGGALCMDFLIFNIGSIILYFVSDYLYHGDMETNKNEGEN